MANQARGETAFKIGDKTYNLALNLGSLAALEDAFGVESYEEVFDRVFSGAKISARAIMDFLKAVIEANGHEYDEGEIGKLSPDDMTKLAIDIVTRAFPEPDKKAGRKAKPENP